MNNLTDTLNAKLSGVDAEEFTKQGGAIEMTSGKSQRIAAMTMPSFTLKLSYKNLSKDEWTALRLAFEQNHSNAFLYESVETHDPRFDLIGLNASVWSFAGWEFSTDAKTLRFSGYINLITSVFYNYAEYLAHNTQSSSYNFVETTDESFSYLLAYNPPYSIKYSYMGNSLTSNIMRSSNHFKDRGGLRKTWVLNWLVTEESFLEIIKFYRKKGGVFNTFGMIDDGGYEMYQPYIENTNDYIEEGFYLEWYSATNPATINHKVAFSQDGFKYQKRIDGFYQIEAQINEVL